MRFVSCLCCIATLFIVVRPLHGQPSSPHDSGYVAPEFDRAEFSRRLVFPESVVDDFVNGVTDGRLDDVVGYRVLVDSTGSAVALEKYCGRHEVFDAGLRATILATRFTPALVDGRPSSGYDSVCVRFFPFDSPPNDWNRESLIATLSEGQSERMRESPPSIDLEAFRRVLKYPEEARREGIEGRVLLKVRIGADGIPTDIRVEESNSPLLSDAAVAAVRSTPWTPAHVGGKPRERWTSIPVVFRLH